jgi:hypothetical protein
VGLCVWLATGWSLGRAFGNGNFGGISTESGGTGNPCRSPKFVGALRNDIKVSQGVKLVEMQRVLEGAHGTLVAVGNSK